MTPMFLFVRSQLGRHRRGWIAVFLLAVFGMAVTITAAAGARRTLTSFERFREVSNEPHALLASEANSPPPVDVDDIRALDGVDVVGEAAVMLLGLTERGVVPGLEMIVIAAADDQVYTEVYVPRLIEGRMPSPDRVDEITISEKLQRDLELGLGDSVVLNGFSPKQFEEMIQTGAEVDEYDGATVQATVVGVTRTTSNLEDTTFQAYEALASRAFYENTVDETAVGAYLTAVRLAGGDRSVPAFVAAVDPLVPDDGPQFEANHLSGTDGVNGAIRIQAIGLGLFGLVALVGTLVAVGQALARQRSLASTDADTLGVLGLTRREIVLTMLAPSALVVAGAAAAAGVVAVLASALLPFGLARRAEPAPGVQFDPLLHLAGPAGVVLLLVVTEAVAARHSLRGSANGLTDDAGANARASLWGPIARSLPCAGVGMRLATSRSGRRSAARSGLAASTFSVAAIASVVVVAATVFFVADDQRAAGFAWDYKIAVGPEGEQTDQALEAVGDSAARLTISHEGYTSIEGRPTFVTGLMDLKGSTDLVLFDGRGPRQANEVVLGRDVARDLGLGVGDPVAIDDHDFVVVGIGLVPIINSDQRHSGAIVSAEAFDLLSAVRSETAGQSLLVAWADGVEHDAAMERIESSDLFGEEPFRPTDLDNLRQIGGIPQALAVFLASMGIAAVGHALITVAHRRRRDLATLRALGFTTSDVHWVVTWQSWTMTFLSLIIGVPVGVVAGRAAWQALSDSLRTVAAPQSPASILAMVPVALVVAFLVAAPIGWRASKHNAALVLRTE